MTIPPSAAAPAPVVYGALGSPYVRKLLAGLRYLRQPYRYVEMGPAHAPLLTKVATPLVPIVHFPDGAWRNDSTPLLLHFSAAAPSRAILPDAPALRFAALLLEDFLDEWAVKWMFHLRWTGEADARVAALRCAFDKVGNEGAAAVEALAGELWLRQTARLNLVASGPETAPLHVPAFHAFIARFERLLREDSLFLFGNRPSIADFALHGLLSQICDDPDSGADMQLNAPFARRWTFRLEDLSGWTGEWAPELGRHAGAILSQAADLYIPVLAENAAAAARGDDRFAVELTGHRIELMVSRYWLRCRSRLAAAFAELTKPTQARLLDQAKGLGSLRAGT